ncbi:MAG: type II toxin-antitoxin system RelE/ParE family toxin [Methylobacter sp.]|nr:type II toxin-antitoxin system RelE/ParE family toxin [Methylobacter sp.]
MKTKFEARFAKDLRAVRNQKLLNKIKEIVDECKSASSLSELNQLKKMQSYDSFYRIRLGEYRIGIEIVDDEIIFTRFLHRKDIYKYFP